MSGINYLFPPDQINSLSTWRFVIHFIAPDPFDDAILARAIANLTSAEWKIVTFPFGLENLAYEPSNNSVGVPVEVPDEAGQRSGSLAEYESDFWKVAGNMMECGFGEIY